MVVIFQDMYQTIQQQTLENGLAVYLKEWPASWVYVGIVVHAGAREDPAGRDGMAHLVEHLVSENVPGFTFSQLEKRFKALGGSGSFGSTSYLATTYSFHFPADRDALAEAFTLFGQMLLLGKLRQHIAEEKAIIAREYHCSYAHHLSREWALRGNAWLFEQHHRLKSFVSADGQPEEFAACTQEELQAFYDRYYVPQNMSFIALGGISGEEMLKMIQQSPFSLQKPGARNPLPAAFLPRPPREHEKLVQLTDFSRLELQKATCTFEWVLPLHFTKYSIEMFSYLLEDMLTEALRYQRTLTYQVEVNYYYYQDCSLFFIHFEVPPPAIETAKRIVWDMLQSVPQRKADFLALKRETQNSIYRMDYSGSDLLQELMRDLEQYQRLLPFSQKLQHLEQSTFEQMCDLAKYLTPERHFCFVLQP